MTTSPPDLHSALPGMSAPKTSRQLGISGRVAILRMLAATPNWRSAPAGSTRITEAWHNTQRFSPSVSWAGSISTISSSLPTRISESAYRKIPLMLKSRVIPVAGWPCDDRMETPVRAIMRWRERRSDLGSDMKVEGYHTPALGERSFTLSLTPRRTHPGRSA